MSELAKVIPMRIYCDYCKIMHPNLKKFWVELDNGTTRCKILQDRIDQHEL